MKKDNISRVRDLREAACTLSVKGCDLVLLVLQRHLSISLNFGPPGVLIKGSMPTYLSVTLSYPDMINIAFARIVLYS